MFSQRVPASTLQRPCCRASAKQQAQRAALDTAAAGPLAPASLYLQRVSQPAEVPPRRGNGTARGSSFGSWGASGALTEQPVILPLCPSKDTWPRGAAVQGLCLYKALSRDDRTDVLTGACRCGQGTCGRNVAFGTQRNLRKQQLVLGDLVD